MLPDHEELIDSIFESADSLPLKLNQLASVTSDFHETLQAVSAGEYVQVFKEFFSITTLKNTADFPVLKAHWNPRP